MNPSILRGAGALLACLLLSMHIGGIANAAEVTSLTLTDAIDKALAGNPELRAGSYRLAYARAGIDAARLRPPNEVALEFENFAGTGGLGGTDALETTLSFTHIVELGDKRDARIASAAAASDHEDIEQRARELDVLAEVTRRFLAAAKAAEQLRLARASERLASDSLAAIAKRVAAARSPLADESRARIARQRAALDVAQAQSLWRARRHALAAAWGAGQPGFDEVRADLFAFGDDGDFASLAASFERNPDFLRFASAARVQDAEIRLARSQARPDLALSLGLRRLEATGDTAWVAGFSLPLAAPRRADASLRMARARLAETDAERDAARVRIRATLFSLYEEMTAARSRALALRDDALPLARTALEQTQAGYDRGRFAFSELAAARQELLALESAAIDSAATYHETRTEIQRLTGAPLTPSEVSQP